MFYDNYLEGSLAFKLCFLLHTLLAHWVNRV